LGDFNLNYFWKLIAIIEIVFKKNKKLGILAFQIALRTIGAHMDFLYPQSQIRLVFHLQ
jgi:hypothetical protein